MRSWQSPVVPVLTDAGQLPPLSLYDSSTRSVRPTAPAAAATMYVCGITPYDATHLGHAATYLAFDLVNRYWRAAGHTVRYVQNVTDIDDPLLERADRDGVDWVALAEGQTELFRQDMTALRVLAPEHFVGAVEAMDEIAVSVATLLGSGAAYRVPDAEYPDVYFDVSDTGRFGYESGYDRETMLAYFAERGGDPDRDGKRDPLDPLLWRMARPSEPAWDSPLGRGRPGWHIECAVIALNRLGLSARSRLDLQGGGSDLIFPHHECSAAHAETLTGDERFAQHYTHAGMLGLDGEKMSKSRGNLVFVSRLRAEGVDPRAIRLGLLSAHYRQDREWTFEVLRTAEKRLATWVAAADRTGSPADGVVDDLIVALSHDLDTPKALAVLDEWAANEDVDGAVVAAAVDALLGVDLR